MPDVDSCAGAASGKPLTHRGPVMMVVIGVAALLVLGAASAAATLVKSPAQARAETAPPAAAVLTAVVERRRVRETLVVPGHYASAGAIAVRPVAGAGGAPVVTATTLGVGVRVRAGAVLVEVSGRPMIALPGKVPAYRDLRPGNTGADVIQLQKALRTLAFPVTDAKGVYGSTTKTAVSRLFRSRGYAPTVTDPSEDQAVAEAQRAVTQAVRAYQDAQVLQSAAKPAPARDSARRPATSSPSDRGATNPPAASATASGGAVVDPAQRRLLVARAREDLAQARADLARLVATTGPVASASELVFLPRLPARVVTLTARVGSTVSGSVMTVAAGPLVVVGELASTDAGLIRTGMSAAVTADADPSAEPLLGQVGAVADAPPATGDGASAGDATTSGQAGPGQSVGKVFTVSLDEAVPVAREGDPVSVTVTRTAGKTAAGTFSVPLAAVQERGDGSHTVTVLTGSGAQRVVLVRAGIVGDGYIEVAPVVGGLTAGDRVVVGVP